MLPPDDPNRLTPEEILKLPPEAREVVPGTICGAYDAFVCTRRPGHDGPHVAMASGDHVCSAWWSGDFFTLCERTR